MRHFKLFVFICFIGLLSACNSPSNQSAQRSSDEQAKQELDSAELSSLMEEENDSLIVLNFERSGETLLTKLEKPYQRIEVRLDDLRSDSLIASLNLPGENRNVYISSIRLPDHQTDGPFGLSMRYATKQPGNYVLNITPNFRASGQPTGLVEIHLQLK